MPMSRHSTETVELSRGALKVVVAPRLGGRIAEFSLCGRNLLFENPALAGVENDQPTPAWDGVWRNFGGEKVWVAPQGWDGKGQWAGPPDPVLDGGYFSLLAADSEKISTRSPDDPKTGLRIDRTISLLDGQSGVNVDASLTDVSGGGGEWSIWPVVQVRADENTSITFPSPDGFRVLHGVVNNPQFGIDECGNCEVSYKYIMGKIGANTNAGWVACTDTANGTAFVASCDFPQSARYPQGTNVQVWTSGRGSIFSRGVLRTAADDPVGNPPYMEIELLSPLTKIGAGGSFGFSYKLRACAVPRGATVKSLFGLGVLTEKLSVERRGGAAFATASAGAFAAGKIGVFDELGNALCEPVEVSPERGARISAEIPQSDEKIKLEYFNSAGRLKIEEFEI